MIKEIYKYGDEKELAFLSSFKKAVSYVNKVQSPKNNAKVNDFIKRKEIGKKLW